MVGYRGQSVTMRRLTYSKKIVLLVTMCVCSREDEVVVKEEEEKGKKRTGDYIVEYKSRRLDLGREKR